MKQNKFMYYILNKNAKIMNALQFIDELGGDIAEGLKKNITKILSYVSPEMQKTLDKLEKIRSGVVKAQTEVENVEHALEYVTSKSEAQKLLRESKQNLNKGYLTGKPLMKLINIVQRNIQNLNVEQRALRKRLENFEKSSSADAEIKKRFFEQFNKEYTTKKLTQDQQRESDVKSIYSLNFDEVDALNKTIKEMSEMARNSRIKTDEQKAEEVRYQVEETKSLIEQGKAGPLEKREQDAGFVKGMTKAGLNAIDQYYSFANYMYERLGLSRMKKQVDQAKIRIDDKEHEMITPIMDRIKTYNMKHQDMQKIGVYGLANR